MIKKAKLTILSFLVVAASLIGNIYLPVKQAQAATQTTLNAIPMDYINYADGTGSDATISFVDWLTTDADTLNTQDVAAAFPHFHSSTADVAATARMFAYELQTLPGKTVTSLVLPNNAKIHIFAMTLYMGVYVDLNKDFNQDAFSFDTNTNKLIGDGAFDVVSATPSTYSADLVLKNQAKDGAAFTLGPFLDTVKNALYGVGQSITLPQGKYSSIQFAGASTNGDQTGTFVITYTDGTTDSVSVTEKDWCTTNTTGQTILQTMNHRHLGAAGSAVDQLITNYIFVYKLTANAAKTVSGIKLPNNADIHLLAMNLAPIIPIQVDLTSNFNKDAFSPDTNRANGNMNSGYSYSSDLVNTNPVYEGVNYTLGAVTDGSNNAITTLIIYSQRAFYYKFPKS